MDLSWRIWTGNRKDTFFRDLARNWFAFDWSKYCTRSFDRKTNQTFLVSVKIFFYVYKVMPRVWRIGIECEMQQIWGVFYQCEEWACLLYEIWLRMYFSQSVCYWYEIYATYWYQFFSCSEELIPILLSVKLTNREIAVQQSIKGLFWPHLPLWG